ncbi:hypothetical protein THOD04_10039 [Vibrio owensii]|uniref:Uncharacterized protein n=1 Tax=Vibrio jasicida TaxID=766224 RepID=A0AAU9QWY2_9VIBR|nr:hypothetical protein THOD04_10039 [Vibrio owensii]CAH1602909.1 hypothetical protein THF1C08_90041 [Vibrio jasicida]CAH1603662.1 hypothetical protein THF1A12_80040 [Vibrio jasicida]CAH1606450.1 hypothetical protein THF5G08_260041 [Vibrio jasicida]
MRNPFAMFMACKQEFTALFTCADVSHKIFPFLISNGRSLFIKFGLSQWC